MIAVIGVGVFSIFVSLLVSDIVFTHDIVARNLAVSVPCFRLKKKKYNYICLCY